jgi:hypothetical protein
VQAQPPETHPILSRFDKLKKIARSNQCAIPDVSGFADAIWITPQHTSSSVRPLMIFATPHTPA